MKSHAVIAEGPVISRSRIPLSHDAFNIECLETRSKGNSTIISKGVSFIYVLKICSCVIALTYAFPPPIIKTSVSIFSRPSNCLPGDLSRDSSSDCKSRFSSLVFKIQIFQSTGFFSSLLIGRSKSLPLHVAAGKLVLKLSEQSMNCYIYKIMLVADLRPSLQSLKIFIYLPGSE